MASEAGYTVNGPLVVASFDLFGITWNLTESVIVQWIVMLILLVVMIILTHKMEVIPKTKRQAMAEWIVILVQGMVDTTMGEKYKKYTTYIGALLCFILINNLMSLLGLRNPTADISVTGAMAIITFVMTQYNRAKTGKVKGYFHAFIEPMPFMLPFNIIGEIANPVSQALRLFGNMVAGMVIGGLIYFALGNFAILIPAVASLYFDIFSAVIQAYIFTTLTMAYISGAECE
ncbi:MAG: F0F1 ATP synthase subunit A [Oscillospiraceae bacterium]|nr:F0F1 ATP synthase subunit A [Oscillospiraceae bacterium]